MLKRCHLKVALSRACLLSLKAEAIHLPVVNLAPDSPETAKHPETTRHSYDKSGCGRDRDYLGDFGLLHELSAHRAFENPALRQRTDWT